MSAPHPDADEPLTMPSSEAAIINNNVASIINLNLSTIAKEASRVQSLLAESEVDPYQEEETYSNKYRKEYYNEGMNSYHLGGSSDHLLPLGVNASLDSPLIPFNDEDVSKSIL